MLCREVRDRLCAVVVVEVLIYDLSRVSNSGSSGAEPPSRGKRVRVEGMRVVEWAPAS